MTGSKYTLAPLALALAAASLMVTAEAGAAPRSNELLMSANYRCDTDSGAWLVTYVIENPTTRPARLREQSASPTSPRVPALVPGREGTVNGQVTAEQEVPIGYQRAHLAVIASWGDGLNVLRSAAVRFTGECR